MSRTTGIAYLAKSDDWETWDTQFRAKAINAKLWDWIDPDGIREPLKEPIRPRLSYFIPLPAQRAAQSSGGPDPDDPPDGSGFQRAATKAEARSDLALAQTDYNTDLKLYENQQKRIAELQDWVFSTVSPTYTNSDCRPDKTLKEWYSSLMAHLGGNNDLKRARALLIYNEAIKPLQRPPTDFSAWLDRWELAMIRGQETGVMVTKDPTAWYADFIRAISGIMPAYGTAFRQGHAAELEKNTLDYRVLSNDFRKELATQIQYLAKPSAGRGSFVSSLNGEASPPIYGSSHGLGLGDAHPETTAEVTGGDSRGQKRGYRNLKSSSERQDESDVPCKICGIPGHRLTRCWYAFPDLAPDGFRSIKERRETARKALLDQAIQEEIERVTRNRSRKRQRKDAKDEA